MSFIVSGELLTKTRVLPSTDQAAGLPPGPEVGEIADDHRVMMEREAAGGEINAETVNE